MTNQNSIPEDNNMAIPLASFPVHERHTYIVCIGYPLCKDNVTMEISQTNGV